MDTQPDFNSEERNEQTEGDSEPTLQKHCPDGSQSEDGAGEQEQKIAQLERELGEVKDRYLRTVAESENIRRRHERERSDLLKYASEGIVRDLLPALDAFDTAIMQPQVDSTQQTSAKEAEKLQLIEGFRLIHKQFLETLKKHGLEIIEAKDVPFDPNIHQAIQMIEKEDATSQTVASVFAKGYSIHGRIVRAAMVSVNVPGN